MTNLSRRATRGQRLIMRAVEGAIRDASNAHPDQAISPRMARSVSKRVSGTLSAALETLAESSPPSDRAAAQLESPPRHSGPAGFHGSEGEGVYEAASPMGFDAWATECLR